MNVLVIGLGSMGKRRIRLLRELYPDFKIFGVDGRADRRQEACLMNGFLNSMPLRFTGNYCFAGYSAPLPVSDVYGGDMK